MESAELLAILEAVRERVRARNPETSAGGVNIALPDLMPLLHARDSAMGKVAAIGTVNPRPGGPVNTIVQAWKRLVSRVLDWHVREQVEFNRKVMACIDGALEALHQSNRALTELGSRIAEADELKDIRSHWAEWRREWEQKLARNEIQFLRSVADLQGAAQHRADLMDANYRDALRAQHADFMAALDRHGAEIQKRLWEDMRQVKLEYERLIHYELRLVRQHKKGTDAFSPAESSAPATPHAENASVPFLDYAHFAERFRGPEAYVKQGQQLYLPFFRNRRSVLDIGCGRGEFLEMMRDAGVPARGIDLGEESVALCRARGLEAETADLFPYLAALPESSLDGIFCAQVVEHIPPARLPEMIRLCAATLEPGGVLAIETPNPECLAIFATHFYLDPTHARPVPHPLLHFYLEEAGFGNIELHRLTPALDSMPALAGLPADFREAFFGALDYALAAQRL